jgi:rhodanese-related sulfurtransferase
MSSKDRIQRKKQAQQKQKMQRMAVMVGVAIIALGAIGYTVLGLTQLPTVVSVDEAYQLREDGAFILDVREPEEWDEKHIPGATLIPLGELAARVDEVPRDQQVVVICRSGNRSQVGRDILMSAGFEDVTSVTGGINQWIESGYEAVFGP